MIPTNIFRPSHFIPTYGWFSHKTVSWILQVAKLFLLIRNKLVVDTFLPGTFQIIIFHHPIPIILPFSPHMGPQITESLILCCTWISLSWYKTSWMGLVLIKFSLTLYLPFIISSNYWSSSIQSFFVSYISSFWDFSLVEILLEGHLSRSECPTHIGAKTGCRIQIFQWESIYYTFLALHSLESA